MFFFFFFLNSQECNAREWVALVTPRGSIGWPIVGPLPE